MALLRALRLLPVVAFQRVSRARGVFLAGIFLGAFIMMMLYRNEPPLIRYKFEKKKLSDNATELQDLIRRDMHLALFTTSQQGYQDKNLPYLFSTWLHGYEDILNVVSDGSRDTFHGTNTAIPGFIDAVAAGGCSTDREWGLICKNNLMFQKWINDPEMKKKKWFFRFMDDTWAHMGNLYEFVSRLDHTKPIVIGDMWCHRDGWTYPSGGPGIIFSRGFWDTFDWDLWLTIPFKYKSTVDDVSLGGYLQTKNIPITHHMGMSQFSAYSYSGRPYDTTQHMIDADPYDLPFTPIAWHMLGHSEWMPTLHQALGSRDYTTGDRVLTIPPCKCFEKEYHRCIARKEKIPDCRSSWPMDCLI